MAFSSKFVSCILKCDDYLLFDKLDTIMLDGKEVYDLCKDDVSFENILNVVRNEALTYLTRFYRNACDSFDSGYLGCYHEDEKELVKEALNLVNPKDDLHIDSDSDRIYLEIDYWDLYASVVDELNQDVRNYNFKDFLDLFTDRVYGGKEVPSKFEPILL